MLASTAVARIKQAGHDISDEYSDAVCLDFLNHAIQQTAALLIAARYPSLVREMIVRNGDSVPQNYMMAAGTYPLRMTGGRVEIMDDGLEAVRFRYFATPENLTEKSQELPFVHDAVNEVIVRAAVVLALNENEYDVAQDKGILDMLQQAVASGMK